VATVLPEGERVVVEPSNGSALRQILFLPASISTRVSEVVGTPTDRRSNAVRRLLTNRRRSPEGERAVVEQLRCDTLSREPEPINPRVGIGEPRVPFSDSDEVGSGDGRPGKTFGCRVA
jgi:hypothetical protein